MTAFPSIPESLNIEERITQISFRHEVEISSSLKSAKINIGCSGIYQLRVNGEIIGKGPCRSYEEYAEYDPYDIQDKLCEGLNLICVEVLLYKTPTFHREISVPYFYASGEIESDTVRHSLDTPGEWLASVSKSYDQTAPKFSFAIGPVGYIDHRIESGNWQNLIPLDTPAPTVKRDIPQLTEKEILASEQSEVKLCSRSRLYSYTMVNTNDVDNTARKEEPPKGSVSTWIYSPEDKSCECLCWWGYYKLNNIAISPSEFTHDKQTLILNLNKGWNFFEVENELTFGKWEFVLSCKKDDHLIFNTDKDPGKDGIFTIDSPLNSEINKADITNKTDSPLINAGWSEITDDLERAAGDSKLIKVDMGGIKLGRVFIECEVPEGTIIDIIYSEELIDDRVHYRKNVLSTTAERWITKAGQRRLETFEPRGLRYMELKVQGHLDNVNISKIGMVETVYPYNYTGTFKSSDDDFNRLWEYGLRTLELCSEDVITDCPSRERTLYGGDLLAAMATAMVSSKDLRLFKRSIDVFMQSFNPRTKWLQSMAPMDRDRAPLYEYPMLTVIAMEWYTKLTGDNELPQKWKSELEAMLDNFLSIKNDRGLYIQKHDAFIMHAYPLSSKENLAFNSCGVKFLSALSNLIDSSDALKAATELETAIDNCYYNNEKEAFIDSTETKATVNAVGNSWLSYFTSCADERKESVCQLIDSYIDCFEPENEVQSVSTYNMFYTLGALYKFEKEDCAEKAIKKVYSKTLQVDTGTIWEHANMRHSLCHAWSTAPNYYLSSCALGIKPTYSDTITIAPQASEIEWAAGSAPHPRGVIFVDWKKSGDELHLEYSVPDGCSAKIEPKGQLAKLKLVVRQIDNEEV